MHFHPMATARCFATLSHHLGIRGCVQARLYALTWKVFAQWVVNMNKTKLRCLSSCLLRRRSDEVVHLFARRVEGEHVTRRRKIPRRTCRRGKKQRELYRYDSTVHSCTIGYCVISTCCSGDDVRERTRTILGKYTRQVVSVAEGGGGGGDNSREIRNALLPRDE